MLELPSPAFSLAAAALLCAHAGAQSSPQIFEVTDSTELFAAVGAAVSGDTILIADNTYGVPVIIDGKGLNLIGSGPGTRLLSIFTVTNVPAGEVTSVSNMSFDDSIGAGSWLVRNNDGAVLFSSIDRKAGPQTSGPAPANPVRVENSASVVFEGCTLRGRDPVQNIGGVPQGESGAGIVVDDSSVWLYDSLVTGGSSTVPLSSLDGGDAVRTRGESRLHLSNSILIGGGAGPGACGGASGGDAIEVKNGTLDLFQRGTQLTAGIGQPGLATCTPDFADGELIAGDPLAIFQGPLAAPAPRLTVADTVTEGGNLSIRIDSQPLELEFLAVSRSLDVGAIAPLGVHVGQPAKLPFLGLTAGDGSLDLTVTVGTLDPALLALQVFVQPLGVDTATLEIGLGAPRQVTVLDVMP